MQQTEKYKLNLIESSDPFLPEALNQNTQKLENALSAAIEEHRAETDARLTVLEAHKVTLGSYVGDRQGDSSQDYNREHFIPLGFRPRFGLIWAPAATPHPYYLFENVENNSCRPADGGICVSGGLNGSSFTYNFLFFA